MRTSECKGCGATMFWAITPTGAKIPLDARATIYRVSETLDPETHLPLCEAVDGGYGISHFRTCPKADRFGRDRKKGASA